jgi:hypothetical protein
MELTFVSEQDLIGPGRRERYPWAEFFEALYQHPKKWALFPHQLPNASAAYMARDRFKDIQVKCQKDHESGLWTVYAMYVPTEEDEVF